MIIKSVVKKKPYPTGYVPASLKNSSRMHLRTGITNLGKSRFVNFKNLMENRTRITSISLPQKKKSFPGKNETDSRINNLIVNISSQVGRISRRGFTAINRPVLVHVFDKEVLSGAFNNLHSGLCLCFGLLYILCKILRFYFILLQKGVKC